MWQTAGRSVIAQQTKSDTNENRPYNEKNRVWNITQYYTREKIRLKSVCIFEQLSRTDRETDDDRKYRARTASRGKMRRVTSRNRALAVSICWQVNVRRLRCWLNGTLVRRSWFCRPRPRLNRCYWRSTRSADRLQPHCPAHSLDGFSLNLQRCPVSLPRPPPHRVTCLNV